MTAHSILCRSDHQLNHLSPSSSISASNHKSLPRSSLGNDDLIKPDRMVLRWLRHHGVDVSADEAREIIATLAQTITLSGKRLTLWEIDHAMWQAGRLLPAR